MSDKIKALIKNQADAQYRLGKVDSMIGEDKILLRIENLKGSYSMIVPIGLADERAILAQMRQIYKRELEDIDHTINVIENLIMPPDETKS